MTGWHSTHSPSRLPCLIFLICKPLAELELRWVAIAASIYEWASLANPVDPHHITVASFSHLVGTIVASFTPAQVVIAYRDLGPSLS